MTYTTPKFIKDAMAVHGYKYSYTKAVYNGSLTPLTIFCREHGYFQQTPKSHLFGRGCPLCGKANQKRASKPHSAEQFAEKARVKHGDKYDYSSVVYVTREEHVTILCPVHGPFEQVAKYHLRGRGCFKCATRVGKGKERFMTPADILYESERARKIRNDSWERLMDEKIRQDQAAERRLTPEQRAERRAKTLAYMSGTLIGKDED